jgi:hypothetical protein
MYKTIFFELERCMTEKTMQEIGEVGEWYLIDKGTYIGIFRTTKSPHMFPKFISNKMALQKVAYQNVPT